MKISSLPRNDSECILYYTRSDWVLYQHSLKIRLANAIVNKFSKTFRCVKNKKVVPMHGVTGGSPIKPGEQRQAPDKRSQ